MKSRVGIVGGGQLGRMLAFEAKRLGFHVTILDPTPNSPAGQVSDEQIVADYKDEKAIRQLAVKSDYLTFEIELANADILDKLSKKGVVINPSAKTLNIIKDKFRQKQFLRTSKIPTVPFLEINNREDILKAGEIFKYPMVLKARFDGYDGRGNAAIRKISDIDKAIEKLKGRKLYVEKFIPFKKELAVIVVRSIKGEIVVYPVVETVHKNNICHLVIAPGKFPDLVKKQAQNLAKKVMQSLKGAGVFGIEMFQARDTKVLINEIAPRVHNSGHFTIEACVTNQFEQHIRAITGMPLGSTDMVVSNAVMINILGERKGRAVVKNLDKVLAIPNVGVHIYGKMETREERKMGHITVIGKSRVEVLKKALKARRLINI